MARSSADTASEGEAFASATLSPGMAAQVEVVRRTDERFG